MLLLEKSNHLLNFLNDMKEFEEAIRNVRNENVLPIRGEIYPGLKYIFKTHIDLNESNYAYVDKFVNILEKNKIRESLINCLVGHWMVELDTMACKSVYSGRVRLHGYMIGQL